MAVVSRVIRKGPGLGQIEKAVAALVRKSVLVGIPSDSAPRDSAPGEKGTPPSNGLIGYILETGDAAMNLPPRPFLLPGARAAIPAIKRGLTKAAISAFSGRLDEIDNGFNEAGLAAVASIQEKMLSGGFAPLADRTIEARARRTNADTGRLSGAATSRNARNFLSLRKQGAPDATLHDAGLATPLLDTRSLFRSVTHVVKTK